MKRIIIIAAFAAILTTGCSNRAEGGNTGNTLTEITGTSGKRVKRQIQTAYFTNLTVATSANVIFTQSDGGKPEITVVGREEAIRNLNFKNKGSKLIIEDKRGKNGTYVWDSQIEIRVKAPDITCIRVLSSGDFKCNGQIDTDNIEISTTSSGDIDIKSLICNNVSIKTTGSGDVDIDRITTIGAEITTTGSGDVEVDNLTARGNTHIGTTGSGDVEIGFNKSGNVDCRITGSGDIKLKGSVRLLRKKVTGSGDLEINKLRIAR